MRFDPVYLLLAVLAAPLYFLPSLLAHNRRHRNLTGVVIVNTFLGWTLLGWVAALVWATLEGQDGEPRGGSRRKPRGSDYNPFE